MAFLFVDRIRQIEPGRRLSGELDLVPGAALPGWLVAEAIGQLAGWAAMAHSDFRIRPVASRAGEVRVALQGQESDRLELSAEIERCDERLVLYRGAAEVGGRQVGSLSRCVGPMLPMELFDDPALVRRHFERLCDGGEPAPHQVDSLAEELPIVTVGGREGEQLLARLQVPLSASFFADHFPRWPVFPATLLLDALSRAALQLAGEALAAAGSSLRLIRVRDVRVRAFTAPGQTLEIGARLRSRSGDVAVIGVSAESDGRRVATVNVEVGSR